MPRYQGEPDYQHGNAESTGVLLVNLGTPEAPDPPSLRRYLQEFLWDPRVIEVPRPTWWLLLHGVILRTRPKRSAEAYQRVWGKEGPGSPLLTISQRQKQALGWVLEKRFEGPVQIALGMRYGEPSVATGLQELRQAGARRVLVLPLYPQYSASTVASTFDAVSAELQKWRWLPELRFVTHYHREPLYIQALANSVREHWAEHGEPDCLVMSFHGLPKRYLLAGDPYHCECHATARLVAEALGLPQERWRVTFQSRFGREEWLRPYTDETMETLPSTGVKRVDVLCPGFSADCLETLDEIDNENRALFLEAGGDSFRYIPALNDRADHIEALAELVVRHCQGWPELADWDADRHRREAYQSRKQALSLGAEQ